jgi:hypothetical protein
MRVAAMIAWRLGNFWAEFKMTPLYPRKPPAKRLFTGMAGSPLSGIASTAEPIAEPTKPKRGRPPKGDHAMTPAERKRQERERIEHESSAPEREELIKKIKKRIKTSEHANSQ